ncbi:MAG: AAA family ATPase [Opitutales bacterium]
MNNTPGLHDLDSVAVCFSHRIDWNRLVRAQVAAEEATGCEMLSLTNGICFANLRPIMEYLTRFLQPPEDHFFLMGPRGTGKTSWTQHRFEEALRIDLLDPGTHRELAARPEKLIELTKGNPDRKQIVLDEIQKLPRNSGRSASRVSARSLHETGTARTGGTPEILLF